MATDRSEPRVGLIFKIGVVSVVLLVAVRTALAAYFDQITQAEIHRKIGQAKPEALMDLRAEEQRRLSAGPMPIAAAMHDLATKGRMAASPEVVPRESRDVAPLQGWTQMPAVVPPPMLAPPAPSAQREAAADAGRSPPASAVGRPAPRPGAAGAPKKKP